MAEALEEASHALNGGGASRELYESAAALYNSKALVLLTNPNDAPPPRFKSRTSGSLIKKAAEAAMRRQLAGARAEPRPTCSLTADGGAADDATLRWKHGVSTAGGPDRPNRRLSSKLSPLN